MFRIDKAKIFNEIKKKYGLDIKFTNLYRDKKKLAILKQIDKELEPVLVEYAVNSKTALKLIELIKNEKEPKKLTKKEFFENYVYSYNHKGPKTNNVLSLYYQTIDRQKKHKSGVYQAWLDYNKLN